MANEKKIAARKKIAAASLALGMGVIGTGFAAGVIDFNMDATHGMGQGKVSPKSTTADVTGDLTISRGQKTVVNNMSGVATQTLDENFTITGFGELTNAVGATYEVHVSRGTGTTFKQEATGTVDANTTVQIPVSGESIGTDVKDISVIIYK